VAARGYAGIRPEIRAFLPLSCEDYRARSGVSGDLVRDLRGIAVNLVLTLHASAAQSPDGYARFSNKFRAFPATA
jgi:hypothetical protein